MQYNNFVHILCANLTKGKIMLYMSLMEREQVKAAQAAKALRCESDTSLAEILSILIGLLRLSMMA